VLGGLAGCRAAATAERAEAEVQAVVVEGVERFNAHDADGWLALFARDAVLVNVNGRCWRLPEDRETVRRVFATALADARMESLEIEVELMRTDVALVRTWMVVGPFLEEDGGRRPAERQLALTVLTREDGRWIVRAFHNTRVASPAVPGR
jgi:uncharacterized protein (TIGR02246 family)